MYKNGKRLGPPCSLEEIRRLFAYDAEVGVFVRKIRTSNSVNIGDVAGCKRRDGYVVISVNNVMYLAHRLAWYYIHGEWPENGIDHINKDATSDNRICNLRPSTQKQNSFNRGPHKDCSTGYKGVSKYAKRKKFVARIKHDGKSIHLGMFDTVEDAARAYNEAAKLYYGEFAWLNQV